MKFFHAGKYGRRQAIVTCELGRLE
jgi:hypothetical protein